MTARTMSSEDRTTIVFLLWQSLAYRNRMLLSGSLILAGFALQYTLGSFFPGFVLLLAGNLLLLVQGYDNRVDFGKYQPTAAWEKVDFSKLQEVDQLITRMNQWDRSAIDMSNPLGGSVFMFLLGFVVVVTWLGIMVDESLLVILGIDVAVLFLPHWLTGLRSIMSQPSMQTKGQVLQRLLKAVAPRIKDHEIEVFMLLKGKEAKVPDDVKFRLKIKGQHPDFLGFYGQVVLNNVKGTPYPYFYVVLVAKKGYGLDRSSAKPASSSTLTTEFKYEGEVEVFVIRQHTTKTSGYHTRDGEIQKIFLAGLTMAEHVAVKRT